MNKFILFLSCFILGSAVYAQKVTVSSKSEKVKGDAVDGYGTELDGKKDEVGNGWIKFLKDIGKVRGSDPLTISEPVFNGLVFSKGVIYGLVKERGEKTYIWLGIKPAEWESNNVSRINNELEKSVYQFGVKYYRDKIQVEIDQAQEALDAVEKQKTRVANQTKDFTFQLSNNEQEKIQLDKNLEKNKFENAVLKVKLDNNKKATDSLTQAAGQIEKVKKMHEERQRKVN